MKEFLSDRNKKLLIVFGLVLLLIFVPFNLVGQEADSKDDAVFLTALESGWNLVSLRYDVTLYKEDLMVKHDGIEYSWVDAVSAGIVNNYLYKWDAAGQMYSFSDDTDPSYGYWVFAYEPCQLWGDVNVTVIGIDGGGSPDYLSKFTGSTTIGSSGVFESGSGNIGIGTTSPSTLLDVAGVVSANGGSSSDWNTAFDWGNHAAAGYDSTDDSWMGNGDVYTTSGKVGIGTSSPTSLLEVNGLIYSSFGGFKFPDGSVQNTAVTGGATTPWIQKNNDIYYTEGKVGIGTRNPTEKVSLWGGDMEVLNENDLGLETLNEGDFSSHNNWTVTGDFDDTFNGEDATYAHNAGSGTLSQLRDNLAVCSVGERWYVLEYTVSNVNINGNITAEITNDFPSVDIPLNLTDGPHLEYFKSKINPTDFTISVNSDTFGTTFTLDDFILKEIIGGDIIVNGLITGGGNSGIKVNANGNVGINETNPTTELDINGNVMINGMVNGRDLYNDGNQLDTIVSNYIPGVVSSNLKNLLQTLWNSYHIYESLGHTHETGWYINDDNVFSDIMTQDCGSFDTIDIINSNCTYRGIDQVTTHGFLSTEGESYPDYNFNIYQKNYYYYHSNFSTEPTPSIIHDGVDYLELWEDRIGVIKYGTVDNDFISKIQATIKATNWEKIGVYVHDIERNFWIRVGEWSPDPNYVTRTKTFAPIKSDGVSFLGECYNDPANFYVKNVKIFKSNFTNGSLITNPLSLKTNMKAIHVSGDVQNTINTSISLDISIDGGLNWEKDQNLDSLISLNDYVQNIILKLNLNTINNSESPKIGGYAIQIFSDV